MNGAWLTLIIAGLLEVTWAIGLKYTDGFNFRGRPLACGLTLAAMVSCMYLLSFAVRSIPIGTGYAIWTGIGALGAATVGMVFLREPASTARVACLLMVVVGMIGLKLTSPAAGAEPSPARRPNVISFYIGGYAKQPHSGIYRATLNLDDGTLSTPTRAIEVESPSFLAMHPTLPVLYAAIEAGKPGGCVKAFQIADDETLATRGEQSSAGDSPCYVSVDAAGRFLLAANYGDGVATVFPLDREGSIAAASLVDPHAGKSVVAKRQHGPHAHSFVPDPSGRWAVSADLGTDELVVYRLDGTPARTSVATLPPGSGPRHIAFSLDGKFAYVCNELSNTLATFSFDAKEGRLALIDVQSTLPAGFTGESYCAEIAMHPNGRFVYVSNRGHDSIAVFRIDLTTGQATAAGHISSGGKWPRHFAIEPGGRFLVVANQRSNTLVSFAIAPETGMPRATGSSVEVAAPSCVRFRRGVAE